MYLITKNPSQSIPSQSQAFNIILCSHCHLSHSIIIKCLFSKRISFIQFPDFFIPFEYTGSPVLNNIKTTSRIPFQHNILIFIILLSHKHCCNRILLLISQIMEKTNNFHKFPILFIFLCYHLFDCFTEIITVDSPEIV